MQGTVYNDNVRPGRRDSPALLLIFLKEMISVRHKLKDGRYYMSLYQKVETGNVDEFLEK